MARVLVAESRARTWRKFKLTSRLFQAWRIAKNSLIEKLTPNFFFGDG